MSAKFKKYVGYFIVAVVLIGLGKQCHREAPVSGTKEYFPPEVSSSQGSIALSSAKPGSVLPHGI